MARCPSPGANHSISRLRATVGHRQHAILVIQPDDLACCRLVCDQHVQHTSAECAENGGRLTRFARDRDHSWYSSEVVDREADDSPRHWQVEPAAILVEELHQDVANRALLSDLVKCSLVDVAGAVDPGEIGIGNT